MTNNAIAQVGRIYCLNFMDVEAMKRIADGFDAIDRKNVERAQAVKALMQKAIARNSPLTTAEIEEIFKP